MVKRSSTKRTGSTVVNTATIGALSARALLVDATIHFWYMHVRDEEISDDAAKKYSTDGSYNKRLVPKEEMKDLRSAFNDVGRVFKKWTLPWSDGGQRILTSAAYFNFEKEIRTAITAADKAADAFADKWEVLVKKASATDKSFKESQYPSKKDMRSRFGITLVYDPVPTGNDFRVDLSADTLSALKSSLGDREQERLKAAMFDAASRVKTVVGHMAKRLAEYKPKEKKGERAEGTFKDSLVDNVRELADLLPMLNVTGDARIDQLVAELRVLSKADAESLREDTKLRKETVAKADAVLKSVGDFI